MTCPHCGHSGRVVDGRCTACGAAVARTSVAIDAAQIDTTGLPPGASFGAVTGAVTAGAATTGWGTSAETGATMYSW